MWRRAAVLLAACLLASGCAGGDDAPEATSLFVTFHVAEGLHESDIKMRLRCDLPSGNVVDPAASCRDIERQHERLFQKASGDLCIGGYSYTQLSIAGRFRGKRLARNFSPCGDSSAISAWERVMRLTALDISVVSGGRTRFLVLSCDPDTGNVADARRTCRSLERDPGLLRGRWNSRAGKCGQAVYVRGLYRGKALTTSVRCDQPARLRRWLEALLGFYTPPPERRAAR